MHVGARHQHRHQHHMTHKESKERYGDGCSPPHLAFDFSVGLPPSAPRYSPPHTNLEAHFTNAHG